MQKVIKFIPNALTLCNLLCGLGAIFSAFTGSMVTAFWFIVVAAIFDFMDGFAAKLLNARSEVGVQLDSLSDVVSFGVAPAFMLCLSTIMTSGVHAPVWIGFTPLLLALAAAYRLAVFNTDTTQTTEFRGLPTPAMGLLVAVISCYAMRLFGTPTLWAVLSPAITLLLCALMVSRVPMFSFKFKDFSFENNKLKFVFAFCSIGVIIWLGVIPAVGVIIASYILISLVLWVVPKEKNSIK